MEGKSVFDKMPKYDVEACIFCKKTGSPKFSPLVETLLSFTDHKKSKTYTFRVGIRTFIIRNAVKYTPRGEHILYSGDIAPNRFDVVFSLDRGTEGSLNLIYHITDCYAGWLFAIPYSCKDMKPNRSLRNPAYKRHHTRIWTTSSVENFAKFLAIGTVGFALVCIKHKLMNKELIEKLLLLNIREMRSMLKSMVYSNVVKDDKSFSHLANIFSSQVDTAMHWPIFKLQHNSSIDEIESDFDMLSSRYKAGFKYLGHYTFGLTHRYMYGLEKPLISEPFGPLKK